MRHIKYLRNGTRQVYDGQFACSLVVVGQRSEAHAKTLLPPAPTAPQKPDDLTEEHHAYRAAVAKHRRLLTAGYFAEKVLEWCERETEAEGVAARFVAPEWVNVRIEPVSAVLI